MKIIKAWIAVDDYGQHVHTIRRSKKDCASQYWSSSREIMPIEIKIKRKKK